MKLNSLLNKADIFDEIDWTFSSLYLWEKIAMENPTSYHLIRFADQLRLSGGYKKAHEIFIQIKLEDILPKNRYYYYINLGKLYEDQCKISLAIKAYRECLKVNSTVPYIFLAALLSKEERLKDAEDILKLALNKKGDKDEVYFNLSTIYVRQGKLESAIEAIKLCLKIDSSFPYGEKFLADFENLQKLKIKEQIPLVPTEKNKE